MAAGNQVIVDFSSEPLVSYLNSACVAKFVDYVVTFGKDLLTEAARLEAAHRDSSTQPQFTTTFISDAAMALRRGYIRPKRSRWLIAGQVYAYGAAYAIGVVTPKMAEVWAQVIFVLLVISAVIVAAVTYSRS